LSTDQPRSIVTYVHQPKRPPPKKAQAAAITGPAIVTAKSKRTLPDMTPEEHQRRDNAADALFRELVRQATGKPARDDR
jgi:hypothetical protein